MQLEGAQNPRRPFLRTAAHQAHAFKVFTHERQLVAGAFRRWPYFHMEGPYHRAFEFVQPAVRQQADAGFGKRIGIGVPQVGEGVGGELHVHFPADAQRAEILFVATYFLFRPVFAQQPVQVLQVAELALPLGRGGQQGDLGNPGA